MPVILGKSGVNRELKEIYLGNSGVNKKEKELYLGKGGINKQIYQSALFTLANVPVDGVTYNFPAGFVATSIEFNANVVLPQPSGSNFRSSVFKITMTDGGYIHVHSESSIDKIEHESYYDTWFQYLASVSGYDVIYNFASATYSGNIRVTVDSSKMINFYFGNVLKYSKISPISTFNIASYTAVVSSGGSASYTNLIIK